MSLKIGIIGLPNVGKSTLFAAMTKNPALIANYPFATIEPNVGFVALKDERLAFLAQHFNPKTVVPNNFKFIDVAGLIKGAANGMGLGNKFLTTIREVDALIQVVRCFEDPNIIHVNDKIDPINDIDTIKTELIFSDLEIVVKRLTNINKTIKKNLTKSILFEKQCLIIAEELLKQHKLLNEIDDEETIKYYQQLGLLTIKPMLYLANLSEIHLQNPQDNQHYQRLNQHLQINNEKALPLCAKFEYELNKIDDFDERKELLNNLKLNHSGLTKVIKWVMQKKQLGTFFTAGPEEVRAWTFPLGWPAKLVASKIHSDIMNKFIMVEIYHVNDLQQFNDLQTLKKMGKYRKEGKKYQIKDGEVCFFLC